MNTEQPTNSEGLNALNRFRGHWQTAGQQLAGPVGPDAFVKATESYEWLSGEKFLIHRFEGTVGGNDASCIEMICYGPDTDSYQVETYYNNGKRNSWQYQHTGDTWILTGSWEMDHIKTEVRCTLTFIDNDHLSGSWEYLDPTEHWLPFWQVESTRVNKTSLK